MVRRAADRGNLTVCESTGETADAARDRQRVLASICRYVRCPRASPIAGAEYRLAGAALCHSPRGDTRTGASHFLWAVLPTFRRMPLGRSCPAASLWRRVTRPVTVTQRGSPAMTATAICDYAAVGR